MTQKNVKDCTIITAGSTYLDIDAYACCVGMAELLNLRGEKAVAYSCANYNYSVCPSLVGEGQIMDVLPPEVNPGGAGYVIVDVSDPEYIQREVPLERVVAVYDHHVGFEEYWRDRIGDGARIEFIGAAATLIFREWKAAGLVERMSRSTALLLIAAILDNTLDLTSSNTTPEDMEAFRTLCEKENIDDNWRATYFSEVQASVNGDLKNALLGDVKTVRDNPVLPPRVAQVAVWDAAGIIQRLPQIRQWFSGPDSWMLNIIDIRERCSYFVCDDALYQNKIEAVFRVQFAAGVAKSQISYLRKEIIRKTLR